MKQARVLVTRYGGPEVLLVVEEECREPRAGEVRVRVEAAGVALPDIMAREGFHPETPRVPYTPGWDLVGAVERCGAGVTGFTVGQRVAAMPIAGAWAEYVCLDARELVPVPPGLDPAEAVALVLNYITAYQMMHRTAKVRPNQRVLIHGAAGGVGTALMQLGRLAGLQRFGTCAAQSAHVVTELGGVPIDYQTQDFVTEIRRLTGDGVDVVFEGIGGANTWRSRSVLRRGGMVVAFGLTGSLNGGRAVAVRRGRRDRFFGVRQFAPYVIGSWILPGRRRVVPYSVQTLKRLKPAQFREDLAALFELLRQQKIKPFIARCFPLAEARAAMELLGKGGITGKVVLMGHPPN